MSNEWIGVLTGVLITLVGALIASIIQRHNELTRERSKERTNVFFLLSELMQHYWWVAVAEGDDDAKGDPIDQEVCEQCGRVSWQLVQTLSKFDSVEHVDDIVDILFNNTISASERLGRMAELREMYAEMVSPAYSSSLRKVIGKNVHGLKPSGSQPPTAWGGKRGG